MTVKQKGQQPSFAGIVVTAGTRDEAVRNYAAVARQESIEVLASNDGSFALATTAGSHANFLNPMSEDKENMKLVDSDLEITSSADQDDTVSVDYTMCSECDAHVIADNCESVSNCPECHGEIDFDRELEDELESDSGVEQELEGDQGILVVASSFDEAREEYLQLLAGEQNAHQYVDKANDVSFVSSSSSINYSPYYGEEVVAEELESDSSTIDNVKQEGSQAHYFMCADTEDCGMHVIASSEDVTICPSCSTAVVDPEVVQELEEATAAMDSEMEDMENEFDDEDDDLLDDDDDDLDDLEADDDDDEDLEDEDFEVVSSGEDESDEDEDDDLDDLESDSSDDDEEDEDDDDEDDEDDDDDESETVEGLDDEEDEEDDEEEEDMESDSVNVSASLDVLSAVANSTEGGLQADMVSLSNVSVVAGENRWIAFHGATPVAMASESNVEGNLRSIFTQPSFRQACLKAVANDGVRDGLAQFGFESIAFDEETMQTAISKEIVAQADAKVEAYEDAQRQRDAKLMERMTAALATSAMGINRGVFAGKTNPIIESLSSALGRAGVENARSLVDDVFEANADNLNRMLVDQTAALMSKSEESQNEIAEMVSASSYARRDGQESTSSTVESRLQPRSVTPKQTNGHNGHLESESSSDSDNFKSRISSALKHL